MLLFPFLEVTPRAIETGRIELDGLELAIAGGWWPLLRKLAEFAISEPKRSDTIARGQR